MTDQRCLTSAIARRSLLTAGPSSSSLCVISHFYEGVNIEKCANKDLLMPYFSE
jgi:hypothetical protein